MTGRNPYPASICRVAFSPPVCIFNSSRFLAATRVIWQLRQIARVVAKQVLSGRCYGLLRRIAEQFPQENGVYRHPRLRRCSDSARGLVRACACMNAHERMHPRVIYVYVLHVSTPRTSPACIYMRMHHAPRLRRFRRFLGAWHTADIRPKCMRFFSYTHAHVSYVYVACKTGAIQPFLMRA